MTYHHLFAGAAALAVTLTAGMAAAELARPAGEIILTVSGAIAETNAEAVAEFDRDMLRAMPVTTFSTTTIWTEGAHEFTGVSLDDFAAALGMTGATLKATAINDYAIEVPLSDAVEGGPIIAYHLDGEPMSVRDKGPLWLIYPFDLNSDYQSEVIYSRSIWQLDRLEAMK
jgi:hypothetical protein